MYLPAQGAAKDREKKDFALKMKNKKNHLKDEDIILNLDEITVNSLDSFYSTGCSGRVSFDINCQTEHGYCEDPHFVGKIKILEANKCDEKDVYLLKVKYDKEEDEYYIEG